MNKLPSVFLSIAFACISVHADDVTLVWGESAGASGYKVYAGTASRVYTETGTTAETTYPVTTLPPNTRSFLAVTAYNAAGESGYSHEIQGWPRPVVTEAIVTEPCQFQDGSTRCTLDVTGRDFSPAITASLPYDGVTVTDTRVVSSIEMEVDFSIAADASGGTTALVLSNPWTVTGQDPPTPMPVALTVPDAVTITPVVIPEPVQQVGVE